MQRAVRPFKTFTRGHGFVDCFGLDCCLHWLILEMFVFVIDALQQKFWPVWQKEYIDELQVNACGENSSYDLKSLISSSRPTRPGLP
jgi:hypothetical protein